MKDLNLKYFTLNEKQVLIALFLIAIILRSFFTFITFSGTEEWTDALAYINYGEQYAQGDWNPTNSDGSVQESGPVIPLLIALFIRLFKDPIIPFFVYNILVTSLLVPVLYYLVKEIFNNKAGWIIALWGVFFVEAFKYSPTVLKEPTLILFVPLTLLFLVKSIKSEKPLKNVFFASLSFAWLIHTDERFFLYFPVFLLFLLLIKTRPGIQYKPATTWAILVVLLMVPWGIRNYKVFDQLVILTPRTTVFTSKLWGENLAGHASHITEDKTRRQIMVKRHTKAMEFGKEHGINPEEYEEIEVKARAFKNFWQPTYFKPTFIQYGYRPMKWSLRHNMASLLFYGIFLPFYIIGLFMIYRRKLYLPLFIGAIPIIHSLLHAYMVWPLERYRTPVTFIVVMIGIWTILELYHLLKSRYFVKS